MKNLDYSKLLRKFKGFGELIDNRKCKNCVIKLVYGIKLEKKE